jgi:hypothetical protein
LFDKWHLGPLRLINFAVAASVIATFLKYLNRWEAPLRPFSLIGRHMLPVFCSQICLSLLLIGRTESGLTIEPITSALVICQLLTAPLFAWFLERRSVAKQSARPIPPALGSATSRPIPRPAPVTTATVLLISPHNFFLDITSNRQCVNPARGGELKKGKFTPVRSHFSLVKAQREVLFHLTDRGLSDTRCFRGGLTLGVHKIPFLEFSPITSNPQRPSCGRSSRNASKIETSPLAIMKHKSARERFSVTSTLRSELWRPPAISIAQ